MSYSDLRAALEVNHGRLVAVLDGLSEEQAGAQSYDDDWSIAQVASHLGSSAEIFRLLLAAGLAGDPAPDQEAMQPVWATWDAKSPTDQVRDTIAADAAFLADADAVSEADRERWRLHLFGSVQTLEGLLRMRLSENTLHTWDIAVMGDPALAVPADAAALVTENLAMVAGLAGKPSVEQRSVEVRTTDPERAFHLDLGPEGVALSPSSDDTAASAALTLPTEAFVRLVYGRLDAEHTPSSVGATGIDLDDLRAVFPGL